METGPPGADCRISPQTARRCLGISSQVVSGPGKGEKTRQVRIRKANESEPRMFCRKTPNRRQNQVYLAAWDKSSRSVFMGWMVTGSSAARAWYRLACGTWEPGAPRPRERPKTQKGEVPVRVRIPMRSAGADWLVAVLKPGNAGGAKGPNRPASGRDQPARGGMLA
jgi:hypothetical protein